MPFRGTVPKEMSFLRLAVIMAGGSGDRFWPLSHATRPKQLLKLTHPEQTLLQEAVQRLAPLISKDRVHIASTQLLESAIKAQHCVLPDNVITEPDKRNTLGCLSWVAANLIAKYPKEPISLAVFPTDQKIGNVALFRDTVNKALVIAEQTGNLVTIGIRPQRPETGFGYIEVPDAASIREPQKAKRFHEKPTLERAQLYVKSGAFLWNSGMFFWRLDSFMNELKAAQPETHAIIEKMANAMKLGKDKLAEELFKQLPSQSIDQALMENSKNVFVVPGEFPWDDVGSWDSLERSFERNADGNVVQGKVFAVDTGGCVLVNESNQKVGVLGVSDLVIVVSQDGILICHKDRAQEVKIIAQEFEKE